jgi:hypothetical protein
MQVTVNSANITTFRAGLDFDIYNRTVTFKDLSTYAGSSGSGRFNVLGISFLLQDQEGVDLATIDFTNPAKYIVPASATEFEIDLSQLSFPFLFQTYRIQAAIKDSDGTVYYTDVVYKKICQPQNLTESGYVPGIFQVSSSCPDNVLTVKELTALVYNNLTPALTTKSGTLSYPTGTIAAVNFTGTPFSNNVIYTGQYRIACTTVSEYDMQDDIAVFVTYLTNNVFDITCANKIADLICCMVQLQSTYLKNCNNAVGKNAKQQLDEVTIPFMLGLTKEINGQDASTEADLIKKTLKCDCGATSIRQNEFTPINPSANNIVIQGVGGTTIPSPTFNGTTKTFYVASNVYQVVKGNTGDLSFAIEVDTTTQYYTKYKITFDYSVMANSILNAISASSELRILFNSLVSATGGVNLSGLDGKCIIDLNTCDYSVSRGFASDVAVLKDILINGTTYTAPGGLLLNNPVAVKAWLDSLSLGTWTTAYTPYVVGYGGVALIQANSNTNSISTVTWTFLGNDVIDQFASTCKSLVDILQAIIDYLCNLSAANISLGNTLTLWLVDYNGNPVSISYANSTQQVYNQALADSIYNIVQWISTLTGLTCAKISALFQDSPSSTFGSSSRMYGKDSAGSCVAWTDKQIANLVIAAINNYSDVKAAFCAIDCTEPAACPEITGINLGIVGSDIGVYGVTFSVTPSATQSCSIMYKRSDQTSYLVDFNALLILPNGNVQNAPPYIIPNPVAGITYDIKIVNNCGGIGFVGQIAVPTGSAYPGLFRRDTILYNLCGSTETTLYTSDAFGKVGQIVYTNISLTTPLTGYNYIAASDGQIWTINPSTGELISDTGTNCDTGVPNPVLYANSTGAICGTTIATGYTNGAFTVGGTLYSDMSLTAPVTGYSYVVNTANNKIYNLNSITGVIGADTTLACTSYSGSFGRSNVEFDTCSAVTETLYSPSVFAPGVTLYTDAGLTTPATGYQFIVDSEYNIYNINAITGVVGSATGNNCLP